MSVVAVIASFGVVYFLAHAFAELFSHTKIPDVLFFIVIGLCLGPFFGIVRPELLTTIGPVLVTVALIIILFESGLGISLATLVKAWSRGVALTIVNFAATTLVVGITAILLTDLTPLPAFLLGTIVGGTSSAIVIPLVRQLQMQEDSKTIVLFESALSDVLCIIAAFALMDAYGGNTPGIIDIVVGISLDFVVAILLGIASALLWSAVLNRIRHLKNSVFATPFFVFAVFGLVEFIGFNGYIAALTFGITLGNMGLLEIRSKRIKLLNFTFNPVALNETEKKIFSELVFLLKTYFFIYIGIVIKITDINLMYIGLILSTVIFIIRIPVVWVSISKMTSASDVSLMAVIVPKGLAAAALASLPLQRGLPGGDTIQNIVYASILFSITVTSILVFLMHKPGLSNIYRKIFSRFGKAPIPVSDVKVVSPTN